MMAGTASVKHALLGDELKGGRRQVDPERFFFALFDRANCTFAIVTQ